MNALPPTRPTFLRSCIEEMPSTMVRKMTGPITIFTRFTNVSPMGFIARAVAGAKMPSSTPRKIAVRTWTVRFLWSRRARGMEFGKIAGLSGTFFLANLFRDGVGLTLDSFEEIPGLELSQKLLNLRILGLFDSHALAHQRNEAQNVCRLSLGEQAHLDVEVISLIGLRGHLDLRHEH